MRNVVRHGLALVVVALVLAGCSDNNDASTTAAGAPSTTVPAPTTTVARPTTTAPSTAVTTTVPAGPAVAEAGGWRIAITAPTAGATIGPEVDVCYEVSGPSPDAKLSLEVTLVFPATGTVASRVPVDATLGRGSARVNLGTPDPRRYDLFVEGIVNGQRVNGLLVPVRGVNFATAPPAGCP